MKLLRFGAPALVLGILLALAACGPGPIPTPAVTATPLPSRTATRVPTSTTTPTPIPLGWLDRKEIRTQLFANGEEQILAILTANQSLSYVANLLLTECNANAVAMQTASGGRRAGSESLTVLVTADSPGGVCQGTFRLTLTADGGDRQEVVEIPFYAEIVAKPIVFDIGTTPITESASADGSPNLEVVLSGRFEASGSSTVENIFDNQPTILDTDHAWWTATISQTADGHDLLILAFDNRLGTDFEMRFECWIEKKPGNVLDGQFCRTNMRLPPTDRGVYKISFTAYSLAHTVQVSYGGGREIHNKFHIVLSDE